jgi:hypothetical protein
MSTPARAPVQRGRTRRQGTRTGDGALDDGPVLEFDGDRLVVQLHEEPARPQVSERSCAFLACSARAHAGARRRRSPDELHDGRAGTVANAMQADIIEGAMRACSERRWACEVGAPGPERQEASRRQTRDVWRKLLRLSPSTCLIRSGYTFQQSLGLWTCLAVIQLERLVIELVTCLSSDGDLDMYEPLFIPSVPRPT